MTNNFSHQKVLLPKRSQLANVSLSARPVPDSTSPRLKNPDFSQGERRDRELAIHNALQGYRVEGSQMRPSQREETMQQLLPWKHPSHDDLHEKSVTDSRRVEYVTWPNRRSHTILPQSESAPTPNSGKMPRKTLTKSGTMSRSLQAHQSLPTLLPGDARDSGYKQGKGSEHVPREGASKLQQSRNKYKRMIVLKVEKKKDHKKETQKGLESNGEEEKEEQAIARGNSVLPVIKSGVQNPLNIQTQGLRRRNAAENIRIRLKDLDVALSIRRKIEQFKQWHEMFNKGRNERVAHIKSLDTRQSTMTPLTARRRNTVLEPAAAFEQPISYTVPVKMTKPPQPTLLHVDQEPNIANCFEKVRDSLNPEIDRPLSGTIGAASESTTPALRGQFRLPSPTGTWKTWRDKNDSVVYNNVEQYIKDNKLMPIDRENRIRQWIAGVNLAREAVPPGDDSGPDASTDSGIVDDCSKPLGPHIIKDIQKGLTLHPPAPTGGEHNDKPS